MKKRNLLAFSFSTLLLLGGLTSSKAQALKGFYYGNMSAPTGQEWQAPDSLGYNKLQPHARFFAFQSKEAAQRVLPENSKYWKSLNGQWFFHWSPNPWSRPKDFMNPSYDVSKWDKITVPCSWNMAGLMKYHYPKYGKPIYVNQRVIFQHQVRLNDWKGGVLRTPPSNWVTYKDRDEVGSYRRDFTIPEDWKGKEIYLNFDGVDNFFYLYVNGKYVGFSKNSRNLAEFDITPYLKKGKNTLAAEVYRSSDGSFLESQDMFRLPGIIRTVSLTAKPKIQVADFVVIPDFKDNQYTDGILRITAKLKNLTSKKAKDLTLAYTLYSTPLYSDQTTIVPNVSATAKINCLGGGAALSVPTILEAGKNIKKWSSEAPYRYVLLGQLLDKKGKVIETFSIYTGFRKAEIKNTPASLDEFGKAGRYYYLNGKPIKFKGVNRHETNLTTGHAVSHRQMEHEVMLMKRANINHVRTSHYPDDPYWYYLTDKYGIYLESEANIESHEYYYGKESLSRVPKFRDAHVARNMEMVHSDINHPSIVIWSLGNEAGPGDNFLACYKAVKAFDTSRPVQYERNNDIVDMGSNQYPSVEWVRGAATGKYNCKYPFHISEYAHSMGNACGDLAEYWKAIESSNFIMGGAIWDWVDQAMYNFDKKTGKRYWAYGGDFGDLPNDGMFCMNGLLRPDYAPKAQYYEVKKVYQNVGVKAIDMRNGEIELFNKNYFVPIEGYKVVWSLWKNGKQVGENHDFTSMVNGLPPRKRLIVDLPGFNYNRLQADGEYFIKIQFLLAKDEPWAKKNYPQMEEQLLVKKAAPQICVAATALNAPTPQLSENGNLITLRGKQFKVTFSAKTGEINTLSYNGVSIFVPGKGPRLDAFRAYTDNDIWAWDLWSRLGLNNLHDTVTSYSVNKDKNGRFLLSFKIVTKAPYVGRFVYDNRDRKPQDVYTIVENKNEPNSFEFTSNLIYTVYPDGTIELHSAINSNRPNVYLPRLGYAFEMPLSMNNYAYYGRGPINNYNDRKSGQFIQVYRSKVSQQGIMLPKPQAQGNREDVRWCAVTNAQGNGAVFISDSVMSASALPYSQQELFGAAHPYQLPAPSFTHLHLDMKVTGLGGNSCGQAPPFVSDRIKADNHHFGFIIRPVSGNKIETVCHVSPAGVMPVSIARDRVGVVTLSSERKGTPICYSVDDGEPQLYVKPFNFRQGGVLKAWYKGNKQLSFSQKFDKILIIPLEVIYADSYEPGEGNPERLLDGNPYTYWHSQYGVTVTKYPHWVDFDAGSQKTLKGFTYLPRQNGANGRIKDYAIYVSNDGKTWGQPVVKGQFPNTSKLQKVMFPSPVKARYIRFMALSEQNGQDFASAAEFAIISE